MNSKSLNYYKFHKTQHYEKKITIIHKNMIIKQNKVIIKTSWRKYASPASPNLMGRSTIVPLISTSTYFEDIYE